MARAALLLVLVVTIGAMVAGQKKRKPIVTSLSAKWSNTPLILEVGLLPI